MTPAETVKKKNNQRKKCGDEELKGGAVTPPPKKSNSTEGEKRCLPQFLSSNPVSAQEPDFHYRDIISFSAHQAEKKKTKNIKMSPPPTTRPPKKGFLFITQSTSLHLKLEDKRALNEHKDS